MPPRPQPRPAPRTLDPARAQVGFHRLGVGVYHPHNGVPHRAEGPLDVLLGSTEGAYSFPPTTPHMVASAPHSTGPRPVAQADMFTTTVRKPLLRVQDQWRPTFARIAVVGAKTERTLQGDELITGLEAALTEAT